jgi:DNA-binding transcriptional MerR regulator
MARGGACSVWRRVASVSPTPLHPARPRRPVSAVTAARRLCYGWDVRELMTVGQLARRTGMSVKAIRAYADAGLIYTQPRSPAGYRLFAQEALWCAQVIGGLRALGLTVAEIVRLGESGEPIGPHLARLLAAAKGRSAARIEQMQQLLARIDEFEAEHRAELAGEVVFDTGDPRAGTEG